MTAETVLAARSAHRQRRRELDRRREPGQPAAGRRQAAARLTWATEEAVYNSLFRATAMTGQGRTLEALPIERTTAILRKYGAAPAAR